MKKIFIPFLLIMLFASTAQALEEKRIELADGSVLEGEIVSFSQGQYTVQSPSLGTLHIADSNVRAIHNKIPVPALAPQEGEGSALPSTADVQKEMQKVQSSMMRDPNTLKTVAGLIADPDFVALAKDPEIMSAAKSLDLKTLLANPKFVDVLNKPVVGEIQQDIKEEDPQN